ncbi:MAG: KamA family radical SAM protein [Thermodesulfobacteriota bacterium]
MKIESTRKKLVQLVHQVPALASIFISREPVKAKRKKIKMLLSDMLMATFEDNPALPPLEWVLTRDAIGVFRNILSVRSEQLAGFSFLRYIDALLNGFDLKDQPDPGPGFLAEVEHLIKGVVGRAGIYPDKIPAFTRYEGRRAAILRSADLSRMAASADAFLKRYPHGLDHDVIRYRISHKARILKHFGATELEWDQWQWQTRHIVRDAETLNALVKLSDEEYQAVKLAREYKIAFGITPYYLSLLDHQSVNGNDAALRAQVIPTLHYVQTLKQLRDASECSMDFMLERNTSPIEGITRRYPRIVILKPMLTCPQICVYCQRNWEIEDVYSPAATLPKEKLKKAIEWIAATPEISEVLITGGDPMLLSNARIENLLYRLSRIKHIDRIRIGTRTPVTLPQRITDSLVRDINHFHHPGKREIIIVTHFEHPYEITPQAMAAVQKFRRYGIEVYNQLVYTFYNSRKFEAAALRHRLRLIGVTPYYTFNTKGKEETDDYRVPIARLLQEQKEEARLLPGTDRTDEIVFNVPGLGKNYLRATQHHDVISILPDGSRVYEFHPWEKQLSLADTYVYTDVPIYDYLKRLKGRGENLADYRSIWYYY